jgi:hypothetical protein
MQNKRSTLTFSGTRAERTKPGLEAGIEDPLTVFDNQQSLSEPDPLIPPCPHSVRPSTVPS